MRKVLAGFVGVSAVFFLYYVDFIGGVQALEFGGGFAELSDPFSNFFESTKNIGAETIHGFQEDNRIDTGGLQDWFSSPDDFFNRIDEWIQGHTGISIAEIFRFLGKIIIGTLNVIIWLLSFILGIIEDFFSLF